MRTERSLPRLALLRSWWAPKPERGPRPEIDLLVSDIVMPEMSGPRLAEQLREERPTLRILYMSGYTKDTILHHGIADDDPMLLQKPFLPDDLARKVREVLDGGPVEGDPLRPDDALAVVWS